VFEDEAFEDGLNHQLFFRSDFETAFKLEAQIVLRPALILVKDQLISTDTKNNRDLANHVERRLTKDGLGRLATVEEMNWSGGTAYATTSYSYNARDQLLQSNQAGQIRSFDYDGYGRLWHKTTPEQGTTSYSYNADDSTNVVTDARGATTTFNYNPRQLVTGLTYGVPGGVAATPNVSFAYDAAGNRTSMTDGLGSTTYSYNQLSQLTTETRNFSGVGSYSLSYAYNLAGELTSITNPWGAQVSYGYDKSGRVTNVGGSGYAGVSSYASGLTYRAFGGMKGMSYGDGKTLTAAYDKRLRPTKWDVSSVLAITIPTTTPTSMSPPLA
jgi:YD repeat-containing protein